MTLIPMNANSTMHYFHARLLSCNLLSAYFCSDVLSVQKREEEYDIADDQVEEFVVFRYELSNILRKHLNEDEKQSSVFGGRNPLSKIGGRPLKDMFN